MSYYGIDLMSSMPAGGPDAGPAVSPIPTPATAIKAPKVSVPKVVAPPAPRPQEEELPDQDTIRLLAKLKKKRLSHTAKEAYEPSHEIGNAPPQESGGSSSAGNAGKGGMGGTGSGIVADAGLAFPYPWYLKAIADRLDKQWHPPQEYAPDTLCQVTFVIDRGGQISGSQMSKSSGDAMFDQLALRAVLYANPLPPLPNGFPDETLKVHMKFVGRRL